MICRTFAALLAWLALAAPAWALGGNDQLTVTLSTGETAVGWYYALRDDRLLLSGDNRVTEISLPLVVEVELNGQLISLAEFQQELDGVRALQAALMADPPAHPPQGVVIGLSALWAGSGHAALGDWKTFAGYSVVEAAILGTGAYNVAKGSNPAVLIPLGALDILFRGYAAADAARITRSRRARLGLRRQPDPSTLEQGLDESTAR